MGRKVESAEAGVDFVNDLLLEVERRLLLESDLAEKVGMSEDQLSKMLDKPRNMTLETMVRLGRALDMEVSVVLYKPKNKGEVVNSQVFVESWERTVTQEELLSYDRTSLHHLN